MINTGAEIAKLQEEQINGYNAKLDCEEEIAKIEKYIAHYTSGNATNEPPVPLEEAYSELNKNKERLQRINTKLQEFEDMKVDIMRRAREEKKALEDQKQRPNYGVTSRDFDKIDTFKVKPKKRFM